MIAALLSAALAAHPGPTGPVESPDAIARRYGLAGELLILAGAIALAVYATRMTARTAASGA